MSEPSDSGIRVLTFDLSEPEKVLAFLDRAKDLAKEKHYTFCALVLSHETEYETAWCSEERSRVRCLQASGLIDLLHKEFVRSELGSE